MEIRAEIWKPRWFNCIVGEKFCSDDTYELIKDENGYWSQRQHR